RLAFLLLTLPLLSAAQGPLDGYLKGKGVLDIAPTFSFNSANVFEGKDSLYDVPFRGNTLSLFAEYGITPTLDAVLTGSMVFTSEQSGLQDGGVYLKYRPLYKKFTNRHQLGLLLGSGLGFPLSDYDPLSTGALGQKAVVLPARAIAQWETPWGPFLNVTGGYSWRLDKLSAEDVEKVQQENPDFQPVEPENFTTLLIKAGFPASKYYADAWIEWQHTKGGTDYVPNVPDLPQAYGVSYTQVGGTVYYSEKGNNGIFLSGGYILKGRNTSRIRRITLGAVFKFGVRQNGTGASHFAIPMPIVMP
ncbi:MAG: hypothetical protein ACOYNO_09940, partial [Saprospiraceae bacterium]